MSLGLSKQLHQTYQQIAVLGMVVTILGFNPRKNPLQPSLFLIIFAAPQSPFTFLSSASVAVPLVCSNVFITSSGAVCDGIVSSGRVEEFRCRFVGDELEGGKRDSHAQGSGIGDVKCDETFGLEDGAGAVVY